MIEIIEGAASVSFGLAHEAISQKVTQKLPGNISAALGAELAGVAVGMFGKQVGIGREISDPIFMAALAFMGARAAKQAMAGKLFDFGSWAAGGDQQYGGGQSHAAAPAMVSVRAPGVRRLGQGSSFGLYPATLEAAGVAG